MAATPFHANILARSIASLWATETMDTREFEGLSTSALSDRDREMVASPAPSVDPRFFGAMRGGNLIIFVLETTPERFLPSNDSLDEFPTLKRLEANSFVARAFHYLPVHESSVVLRLCIMLSLGRHVELRRATSECEVPGPATALEAAGYQTGFISRRRCTATPIA